MKILWLCFVLQTINAANLFGTSYLKNNQVCRSWTCLNTQLGFQDALPPREQTTDLLKTLLPAGSWRDLVGVITDACYGDHHRAYTNTCPGQALLHCIVDQMVKNCPEDSWVKEDSCSQVTSLAGFKYLVSQSRYKNMQDQMSSDRRPSYFLTRYFNTKCCNLPPLFDAAMLEGCGFNKFLHYYVHAPNIDRALAVHRVNNTKLKNAVQVVAFTPTEKNNVQPSTTSIADTIKIVKLPPLDQQEEPVFQMTDPMRVNPDPLDCCNLSGFIERSWRSECDFHMTVDHSTKKLEIDDVTDAPVITEAPRKISEIRVVPLSCPEVSCVFQKLNIVSASGHVDLLVYIKLLDDMVKANPVWSQAKQKVVSECLIRPNPHYNDECEINQILSCTFDVLSENCPHGNENLCSDPIAASNNNVTCQINSSGPKMRRPYCQLPNIVSSVTLAECGLQSLSRVEINNTPITTPQPIYRPSCKSISNSSSCIMNKMRILNKYGFMDYFKMKAKLRQYAADAALSADVYLHSLLMCPMYTEHCNSPRKFLNILHDILMTCPVQNRETSPQCSNIFNTLYYEHEEFKQYQTSEQYPSVIVSEPTSTAAASYLDLFFGTPPPVEIINIRPSVMSRKPLVKTIQPVYMRPPYTNYVRPSDGIYRSAN